MTMAHHIRRRVALLSTGGTIAMTASARGFQTLSATYGYSGGEIDLIRRGLIGAGSLDALKARCALALLLSDDATPEAVRGFFQSFD